MKIEDHLININNSIETINECIQKDVIKRQRTIAFNISVTVAEMLELYLHKNNLINPGTMIKHEMFNSIQRVQEFLNFEFNNKEKIIELYNKIEKLRNILCYGKPQQEEKIKEMIELFNEVKNIFEKEGIKWN